jgi:hypothetical protein
VLLMAAVATTERSVVDVLRAARERISNPEKWARGQFAYRGPTAWDYTTPDSPEACRWCAAGAVLAEYDLADLRGGLDLDHAPAIELLARVLGGPADDPQCAIQCIADFNDALGHSHADVLSLFDQAIELAGSTA